MDDSYNANPAAVRAAVDVLAREPVFRVLILGPMLELGDSSATAMCWGLCPTGGHRSSDYCW